MRDRNRFLDRHARVHSRCILNYNIPPILHFILLGLAFIHTAFAMTIPNSDIHKVIKWLEPSTFIPPQIIVYLLIFPVMFSSTINILQVVWALKETTIKTSIFKHYLIKFGMVTSHILCYGFLQPIISSALRVFIEGEVISCVFAGLILGFFIPNVFLFLTLNLNLSPYENRTYALFDFPNAFTCFHLMRVLFAVVGSLNSKGIPILALIVLIPFTIFLLRNPIITWRYNKLSQIVCGMTIYWQVVMISEFFRGSPFRIWIYLIAAPFIGYFFTLALEKRVTITIQKTETSILQIRSLLYMVENIEGQRNILDLYLMNHLKHCDKVSCKCERVLKFYLDKNRASSHSEA